MEEQLPGLELPLPDQETFERVWKRVMPDQSLSPVTVGAAGAAPAPQQAAAPPGDGDLRLSLLERGRAGAARAQALLRRAGGRSRPLSELSADHQRALRQLSALYFLLTGENCPAGEAPSPRELLPLPQALREQYLWEREWSGACLQGSRAAGDPALRELLEELAQDGALHGRAIRGVLERLPHGPLRLD